MAGIVAKAEIDIDAAASFQPLGGQPDAPENYHTLMYQLSQDGERTHLSLSQDNNATADEAEHAGANWSTMLAAIKDLVERP